MHFYLKLDGNPIARLDSREAVEEAREKDHALTGYDLTRYLVVPMRGDLWD